MPQRTVRASTRPEVTAHKERAQSLHENYLQRATPLSAVETLTDEERYQWIRANRGSTMILDALASADFDSDFDAQIDAAVHAHRCGRHLPMPTKLARPMYGRRRTD